MSFRQMQARRVPVAVMEAQAVPAGQRSYPSGSAVPEVAAELVASLPGAAAAAKVQGHPGPMVKRVRVAYTVQPAAPAESVVRETLAVPPNLVLAVSIRRTVAALAAQGAMAVRRRLDKHQSAHVGLEVRGALEVVGLPEEDSVAHAARVARMELPAIVVMQAAMLRQHSQGWAGRNREVRPIC